MARLSGRPSAMLVATAVALIAGAGLAVSLWPHGSAPAAIPSPATTPSTATTLGATPGEVLPSPLGPSASPAGSPAARGGVVPGSTGSRAGDSSVPVTPMVKPHALPPAVVLPWAVWKQQASTVCRIKKLPIWADRLDHGTDAAATDPASKRYAVEKLGAGAADFHSILSGLAVSGTTSDLVRRSELLDAAEKVADAARVPGDAGSAGSAGSTSVAWHRVARALSTDSIDC